MKRKVTKERTPSKNLTPDEVFADGPIQVIRKGRLVQASSQLSSTALKAMQDSWPQQRENIRSLIAAKLQLLVELIQEYNPLPCLFVLFAKNCLVDIETYAEPEDKGSEALVEYAHSIITAVPNFGSKEPGEEQFELFEDCVSSILEACQTYFTIKEQSPNDTSSTEETKFIGMMRHIFIRGSSIIGHDTDLILKIFEPHDNFFRRNALFTVAELIDFSEEIKLRLEKTIQNQLEINSKAKLLHQEFVAILKTESGITKEEAMNRVKETELGKSLLEEIASAREDFDTAHIVPLSDKTRIFCEKLSLSPGQNNAFLSFAKSPGWPTNDSKIFIKPLIEYGKYYAPNPVLLLRNRFSIMEEAIKDCDPKYFGDQYSKVRGKIIEELALAHMQKLLPKARIFRNLYYRILEDAQEKRCETDGIVIFDDRLFILEMKSAPFSKAAMRGADKRLREDLTDLVDEPYQQAVRTLRFINENADAQFEFEDGSVAVTLNRSIRFRRIYLINVTLSDIGHVAARLNSAREMGLVQGKEWPWSVFINDLRVIAEILESPSEFLLYVERRLALNELSAVWTIDELDYLGMFLKEGLYFEKDNFSEVTRFTPIGYTVPIERYYNFISGHVSSGEKPRFNISDWYRQLVRRIEATDKAGAYHVGSILLSFSGERHAEIEAWFREYSVRAEQESNQHSLTFNYKDVSLFVFYVTPKLTREHILNQKQYGEMKRLQTRNPSLISISLEGKDMKSVDFEITEGPLKDNSELQNTLLNFRKTRYRAFLQQYGKPGRNEPCPCNSGQKFKKCCLNESAAW